MRIRAFLEDAFFTLPKQQHSQGDFKQFAFQLLDDFLGKIKACKDAGHHFEDVNFTIDSIYERQTHLIKKIKEAIEHYYNGKPAKAFHSFGQGLVSNVKDYRQVLNIREFMTETNFYRIRSSTNNYSLSSGEFFHIPFHMRGKVSTQRFSIPGFPSLYLGNTVYVCWEELKRPNIDNFQAVRLQNREKIRVIDLSPPRGEQLSDFDFYRYLMIWPVVLACSVKVKNTEDTFKPEYIIPQLLLQWVREEEGIDGISYQTTTIDFSRSKSKGEFLNIVLPVKDIADRGLCNALKQKFEMSEATSLQLGQATAFIYNDGENESLHRNVQQIELVRGVPIPYANSSLAQLERMLTYMQTHPIDDC